MGKKYQVQWVGGEPPKKPASDPTPSKKTKTKKEPGKKRMSFIKRKR